MIDHNTAINNTVKFHSFTFPVNKLFPVSGKGYWSDVKKDVLIDSVEVTIYWDEEWMSDDFCIYFKEGDGENDWDTNKEGLIYSDNVFIEEFKEYLATILPIEVAHDITYSEQGMQGDNYVSCDALLITQYLVNEYELEGKYF